MTKGPATAAEVRELLSLARDVCGRLDPACVGLQDVPGVFDDLVALERLAGGAVTRMAARYDEAGSWKAHGARSAEDELARKTGTTKSRARRKLRTSKRLRNQPSTDRALQEGEVSSDQADEVSDGADASPESEGELLDSARRESLRQLRQRAADAKARADADREATRRRLHRQRCVRRWNDPEGMGNLLVKLPADEMAEIDAALKRPIDQRFADARDAGRFEPHEAYAADVVRERLLGASAESGSGRSEPKPAKPNQAVRPDKKVIAVIDLEALNRGHVESGERCEIAGVGSVSVAAVRRLMSDAFVAVVATDASSTPTAHPGVAHPRRPPTPATRHRGATPQAPARSRRTSSPPRSDDEQRPGGRPRLGCSVRVGSVQSLPAGVGDRSGFEEQAVLRAGEGHLLGRAQAAPLQDVARGGRTRRVVPAVLSYSHGTSVASRHPSLSIADGFGATSPRFHRDRYPPTPCPNDSW